MKTLLKAIRGRVVATLRDVLTLGAVLPGDEEHDAWEVPTPGKVIRVDFGSVGARGSAVTQTR